MAKESASNIAFKCDEHAPKPNPQLKPQTPEELIGKYVKKAFEVKHPETKQPLKEHMWVMLTHWEKDVYQGTLNNDPIGETDLCCGDLVTVSPDEIEDVYVD